MSEQPDAEQTIEEDQQIDLTLPMGQFLVDTLRRLQEKDAVIVTIVLPLALRGPDGEEWDMHLTVEPKQRMQS